MGLKPKIFNFKYKIGEYKSEIFIKIFVLIISLLSYFYLKTFFYFFLPGFLILFLFKYSWRVTEIILFSVSLSIGLIIVLFGLTKFIPIEMFLLNSLMIFFGLIFFFVLPLKSRILFKLDDLIVLAGFILMLISFLNIYRQQIFPPGADMATHTYTAQVISLNRSFPNSYYPLVPIDAFGFMPYGMSVIISYGQILLALPIYKAALLVVLLIYPFAGLALYSFLKNYFSSLASFLTVIFVLLVERDWLAYFKWGGNPTVFAIFLMILAVTFFLKFFKEAKENNFFWLVPSLFLAASFQSHQTPLAVLFYAVMPLAVYLIIKKDKKTFFKIAMIFIVTGILALPMLTSFEPLSKSTIIHINENIHASYFGLSGNFKNLFSTILSLVHQRLGQRYFLLTIAGIIIAYYQRIKYRNLWFWFYILIFVLVIDSIYLFTPLSRVFYPDRVISTLLFATAFFFAVMIDFLWQMIKKINYKKEKISLLVLFLTILIFFLYLRDNVRYIYLEAVSKPASAKVSVTVSDLQAFEWIEKNTPTTAVIKNNYGDAGIWIPAIAKRMITYNDTSPHYMGRLYEKQKELKPDYIFIGNKIVYPKTIFFKAEEIDKDPNFELVFRSDNSRLYKIKNNDK